MPLPLKNTFNVQMSSSIQFQVESSPTGGRATTPQRVVGIQISLGKGLEQRAPLLGNLSGLHLPCPACGMPNAASEEPGEMLDPIPESDPVGLRWG